MQEHTGVEPTLLETAKRHPVLIAAIAIIFGVLAWAIVSLFFDDWGAEASVLIEDPAASQVFDTASATSPERHLAAQIALIESSEFARAVQEVVDSPNDLSISQIMSSRDVSSASDANVIVISFTAESAEAARDYANAYADAYRAYREETTIDRFESAMDGLDQSIANVDAELAEIDEQLASLSSVESGSDLEQALQEEITAFLADAPDTQSTADLEAVLNQLQTLQIIRSLEAQDPSQALLMETRRDSLDRRSQLVLRRDQLAVDASLATTGISAISEANTATRSVSTARVVAVGVVLGLLVGVAFAYYRSLRNRRFLDRHEPESTLNVPLLYDVPVLSKDGQHGMMPVARDAASPAAESFRFVSDALMARLESDASSQKALVFTSALMGDGKTSVTLNTGLALAKRGKSVLLVDADFGDPTLSQLLIGSSVSQKGVTDIVSGETTLRAAAVPVDLGGGIRVDVLTRGTVKTEGGDVFNSSAAKELLDLARVKYDMVLIDSPPLLQISYSLSVAKLADGVVIVIPHEGLVAVQRDLIGRLGLIDSSLVGYVYSKAPKRPEFHERGGSMRDPLGSGQLVSR